MHSKKMPGRRVALLLRIPQGLKDQLADHARREHRSLNQQIEFLLEEALSEAGKKRQNDKQEGAGSP